MSTAAIFPVEVGNPALTTCTLNTTQSSGSWVDLDTSWQVSCLVKMHDEIDCWTFTRVTEHETIKFSVTKQHKNTEGSEIVCKQVVW